MNKLQQMGIIKSEPKKWTEEDISILSKLKNSGLSNSEIAYQLGRTEVSIQIKLKRLKKTNDTYNEPHRNKKYASNELFLEMVKPHSLLDVYAGKSFYIDKVPVLHTNDKDKSFDCTTHEDAFTLLCKMCVNKKKFDVVDLDPYGSAIDNLFLALKIAKTGVIITLGEMGHRRWKRLDFVRKWYGINKMEDFTTENLIKEIERIGRCSGKKLIPVIVDEYRNISRVYFRIEKLKTTEQWDVHN